jgi:peptidoglycan/LPS O-acetylase OafA/YrhL
MRTQTRLEKISTTISLAGLALGFSALGVLIVAKSHGNGTSLVGGILGILLGSAFLIAACLHWKRGDGIPGNLRVDEVPSAEIVSEIRRAANAIYGF